MIWNNFFTKNQMFYKSRKLFLYLCSYLTINQYYCSSIPLNINELNPVNGNTFEIYARPKYVLSLKGKELFI